MFPFFHFPAFCLSITTKSDRKSGPFGFSLRPFQFPGVALSRCQRATPGELFRFSCHQRVEFSVCIPPFNISHVAYFRIL